MKTNKQTKASGIQTTTKASLKKLLKEVRLGEECDLSTKNQVLSGVVSKALLGGPLSCSRKPLLPGLSCYRQRLCLAFHGSFLPEMSFHGNLEAVIKDIAFLAQWFSSAVWRLFRGPTCPNYFFVQIIFMIFASCTPVPSMGNRGDFLETTWCVILQQTECRTRQEVSSVFYKAIH